MWITLFFPQTKMKNYHGVLYRHVRDIFMIIWIIIFNGDLPFDMMVILNFVVLTTNIRGGLRRTHGFSSETIKQVCMFFFLFLFVMYQITTNQIKCWFLVRGEIWSTHGQTSHSRVENQQTQPGLFVIYLKIHDVVHL